MLLACPDCHRQYEVGAFAPGARIRCLCGRECVVREQRPRQAPVLHCSSCGGKLRSEGRSCEYCSAEVALADRGLGPACPECLATTLAGARHCQACGVRLAAEGIVRALASRACPRCKQQLAECETPQVRYVECPGCGGLWLDEELFERLAREHDTPLPQAFLRGGAGEEPARRLEKSVRYVPCPVCRTMMNRRNFAGSSGVVLDWCRGHGWWFDAGELERALEFVRAGGLERARRLEHERRKQELQRIQVRRDEIALPAASLPLGKLRGSASFIDLLQQFLMRVWS